MIDGDAEVGTAYIVGYAGNPGAGQALNVGEVSDPRDLI